jgi:hypothetical protein
MPGHSVECPAQWAMCASEYPTYFPTNKHVKIEMRNQLSFYLFEQDEPRDTIQKCNAVICIGLSVAPTCLKSHSIK